MKFLKLIFIIAFPLCLIIAFFLLQSTITHSYNHVNIKPNTPNNNPILQVVPNNQIPITNPVKEAKENHFTLIISLQPADSQLEPPGQLLVTDPLGKKLGWDPTASKMFAEISSGSYSLIGLDDDVTEETGPRSIQIYILRTITGTYSLQITGNKIGVYNLEIHLVDPDNLIKPFDKIYKNIALNQDQAHKYTVVVPNY